MSDMQEKPHWFAEWFSSRMPIFVPDAVTERRIRRWTQKTDQRTARRCLVGAIVFMFVSLILLWAGEAWIEHVHPGNGHGMFYRLLMLIAGVTMSFHVGVVLYYSNVLLLMGTDTLEDLAGQEYGLPYDELAPWQRREMLVRRRAKMMTNCFHADERQSAEQEWAERAAYRLLRQTGMAIMVVAWVAYLIAPGRAFGWLRLLGGLLMNSPLIFTLLVVGVVALPVVIRLWMEPDERKEMELVVVER